VGVTPDRTAAEAAVTATLAMTPRARGAALAVQQGPMSGRAVHTCRVVMLAQRRDR
jgi:hypothetical protein